VGVEHRRVRGYVIDRFTGEFEFLSNYYEGAVRYKGTKFPSSEHAYQCQKIPPELWHKIIAIKKPSNAKRAVKTLLNDPSRGFQWDQTEWDKIKVQVMREILRVKFSHPMLSDMLRDTKPARLIEGNTWKDKFWGIPVDKHGALTGVGENWLGRLLMEIRDEA
jgi:ribA/ribD-fused uncharacterized protein